jgi:hypothetical protein
MKMRGVLQHTTKPPGKAPPAYQRRRFYFSRNRVCHGRVGRGLRGCFCFSSSRNCADSCRVGLAPLQAQP